MTPPDYISEEPGLDTEPTEIWDGQLELPAEPAVNDAQLEFEVE